jgi:hypothetical protein
MTTNSNEPSPDAIVSGIHQIREDLLKAYNDDLRAYFDSARQRQYQAEQPIQQKKEATSK